MIVQLKSILLGIVVPNVIRLFEKINREALGFVPLVLVHSIVSTLTKKVKKMPKERIEIQKSYSIEDCKANPHKFYIFGDNLIHQGCGGQAIIRYCDNAFGIPTKRLPTMDENGPENPFFSDQPQEIRRVNMRLATLMVFYDSEEKPTLVFPLDLS